MSGARYLQRVVVADDKIADPTAFPYCLPMVPGLSLPFTQPVTFLVGENGSGKSTLIEAIAEVSGLQIASSD